VSASSLVERSARRIPKQAKTFRTPLQSHRSNERLRRGSLPHQDNVTWQLFPIQGSFFDPRVTGAITAFVAAVIAVWARPQGAARRK